MAFDPSKLCPFSFGLVRPVAAPPLMMGGPRIQQVEVGFPCQQARCAAWDPDGPECRMMRSPALSRLTEPPEDMDV